MTNSYRLWDVLSCSEKRKLVRAFLCGMRAHIFSRAFCELSKDKLCVHASMTQTLIAIILKALARSEILYMYLLKWARNVANFWRFLTYVDRLLPEKSIKAGHFKRYIYKISAFEMTALKV